MGNELYTTTQTQMKKEYMLPGVDGKVRSPHIQMGFKEQVLPGDSGERVSSRADQLGV